MECKSCGSHNQCNLGAEVAIHFPGLKNITKPPVFVFPKLLICLDCGITEFAIPGTELGLLAAGEVAAIDSPSKVAPLKQQREMSTTFTGNA